MSEEVSPVSDPRLQEQLARNRNFDVLRWDPTVVEHDLHDPNRNLRQDVSVDLANCTPLQVVGDKALVAVLEISHENRLNVWGYLDEGSEGKIATDSILLTDEAFDPESYNAGGEGNYMPVQADSAQTVLIGRDNADLEKRFRLGETVSRKHAGIRLSDEGVLNIKDYASMNGTKVLVKSIPNQRAEHDATSDVKLIWPGDPNDSEALVEAEVQDQELVWPGDANEVGKAAVKAMIFDERAAEASAEQDEEIKILNRLATSSTSLLLDMYNQGDARVKLFKNHEGEPVLTMNKGDYLVLPRPREIDNFGKLPLRKVEILNAKAVLDEHGKIAGFTSVDVNVGGAERRDGSFVGQKVVLGDSNRYSNAEIDMGEDGNARLRWGNVMRDGFSLPFDTNDKYEPQRAAELLSDIQNLVTQAQEQFTGPDSLK